MLASLPKYDVVLLGVGHTNAHVLRMWRMQPIDDARLICVSNFSKATYSGMLPGTLAGQYDPEAMEIDLVRLCAAAGATLILGSVRGLDVENRELLFDDRPPLPCDVLSIGVGSIPRHDSPLDDVTRLAIKPMQTFLPRLERRLTELAAATSGPLRLAVVGAGAGGVEIAFCLPSFVRKVCGDRTTEITVINALPEILSGAPPRAAALARRELESRGVKLRLGQPVIGYQRGTLRLADGSAIDCDLALWATSAVAPPLLAKLGLPLDDQGFLLTRPTLQTTADAPIFAVGDTGTSQKYPTRKAGVYAVRQGPILWENIQRLLRREPLAEYVPQRDFLSLLNTGDGRAILAYYGRTAYGRWCWKLKDYIDRRFMRMYQDYRPMPMAMAEPSPNGAPAMRCAGCGGKVGGSVLSKVLRRLDVPPSEHVLLGLDKPDDAAVVQMPGGRPVVATADFFTAFVDDPYLVGRVAALNAASDLFAMGAKPVAALALATIPVGPPRKQEQLLYELLAGGLHEFRRMGATLVGGHTIEGPQVTIGYSMIADAGSQATLTKGGLRQGDLLVLTKPLGSGVLLAAHMQAACQAEWMDALVPVLLASNQEAADAARQSGVTGLTDITGFGLAGHMLEMLRASNVAAEIDLGALPLLPGAEQLVGEGWQSTLAPANRAAESDIDAPMNVQKSARYALLFDPQTSGGLLIGVAEHNLQALLGRLREIGPLEPAVIGRVVPSSDRSALRVAGR